MTNIPKVAIFYDIPDWAFHNIARNISTVTPGFDFDMFAKADWVRTERPNDIIREYDILVFLWRFDVVKFIEELGEASLEYLVGPNSPAVVTLVYDHLHQTVEDIQNLGNPFEVCDVVCSSSERLRHFYNETPHLPDIYATLPDGVNTQRFSPSQSARDTSKPLVFGWVGNSEWGKQFGTDFKGRRTIFDPALEILTTQGKEFATLIADRAETRVSYEDMPDFYRDLDVLVCTSLIEGTPNPVLEALASGAAIVSTDCGIVPQVLGERQSEFIIERNPEAFAQAMARLIDDRELHLELCAENTSRKESFTWKAYGPLWVDMFEEALKRREKRGPHYGDAVAKLLKNKMSAMTKN